MDTTQIGGETGGGGGGGGPDTTDRSAELFPVSKEPQCHNIAELPAEPYSKEMSIDPESDNPEMLIIPLDLQDYMD